MSEAQESVEPQQQVDKDLETLSNLYLFGELFKFARESTGIAIAMAYLVLILSSTAYLSVFYNSFNIGIVKYITFEDILAAPIKNTGITVIFIGMIALLYVVDVANRFRARQQIKYQGLEKPFGYGLMQIVFWSPKNKKNNIKTTLGIVLFCLTTYSLTFAKLDAEAIKEGNGSQVQVTLTDGEKPLTRTLLGTTVNFVFVYHADRDESTVYYLESVKSITGLSTAVTPVLGSKNGADGSDTAPEELPSPGRVE